jgi:hypothetical protein
MMSLSTIVVAANAQLLRRVDLRPRDTDPQGSTGSTDGTGTVRRGDRDRREERV